MHIVRSHCAFVHAVEAAAQGRNFTRLTVWFGTGEVTARWEAGREGGQIVTDTDPKPAAR
jgi:hypothetical protein